MNKMSISQLILFLFVLGVFSLTEFSFVEARKRAGRNLKQYKARKGNCRAKGKDQCRKKVKCGKKSPTCDCGADCIHNPDRCTCQAARACCKKVKPGHFPPPTATLAPTASPTEAPTASPTAAPTASPTAAPVLEDNTIHEAVSDWT